MDTENGPGAHPAPDPTDTAIYRHWEAEHVRFSDLDPLGHANNNAIGVYMETGRLGFHRAVGAHRHVPGRVFVLARTVVDYRAEVLYPGDLRVGVRLVRVGRTSWTLGTGLFVGDRCAATGEAVIVLIDRETRRPSPLPDALRQALESLN